MTCSTRRLAESVSRTKRVRGDLFRELVSSAVGVVAALGVLAVLALGLRIDVNDRGQWQVIAYIVAWPLYGGLYVGWSYVAYTRLSAESLRRTAVADDRGERRPLWRILGLTGTTSRTVTAAVVAVVITIVIAQRPEFQSRPVFVALALLTVATSWLLMVFSFAQGYLRLGVVRGERSHLRFHVPGEARFGDYLTLAVLISTMAATASADISSRPAWRLVRTNVIIAFVFNSVIIAMMVSLLFGGLLA